MTRLRWFLALPAFLIATTGPSDAAEIRDKAGLFSEEAVKKAQAELDRIEKEYKVPVAIETIDSLEGRKINSVLAEHARAADAKGLYVLISKVDHSLQVETYKSYAKYLTPEKDLAIRDTITREFKGGNFDAGLIKGLEKIDSTFSEARTEAGGSLRPTTTPAPRRGGQAQAGPGGRNIPAKPSGGGMSTLLTIGLGLLALFIVIRVLGALFSGGNRGYASNQRMMGPGGPGGPGGYGPGYGGGYGGGGGGGGFMSSMFGGIGGALAGNWLYDQFSGRHQDSSMGATNYDPNAGGVAPDAAAGPDYVGPNDNGGDWGGGSTDTGGDWGGGGGADTGGGGGDWGGGGGGDWGGGGGGGDDGGSW